MVKKIAGESRLDNKGIFLTAVQMQELDRFTIEVLGIPQAVLMENAGLALAQEAIKLVGSLPRPIAVFCGPGNNGGDGMVAARYLVNLYYPVDVFLVGEPARLKDTPRLNKEILGRMGKTFFVIRARSAIPSLARLKKYALLIDALLGIGFRGRLREPLRGLIKRMNTSGIPILACDVPSGLDATTGRLQGDGVRAVCTVTFGFAKTGFLKNQGPDTTGTVVVRDIGIPAVAASHLIQTP